MIIRVEGDIGSSSAGSLAILAYETVFLAVNLVGLVVGSSRFKVPTILLLYTLFVFLGS